MSARIRGFAVVLLAGGLVSAEPPTFQPGVKDYRKASGTTDYSVATIIYQEQEQCRIGAEEIPSKGRKLAYAGGGVPADGIAIAIADSAFGKKLIAAFALDVPGKRQGYVIRVDGPRAAIIGHDAIGTLYGAVTFRQMMANEGKVESATVRDWPDILERGGVSFGRGLWKWTKGLDTAGRAEEVKRCIDELVRHKINGMEDVFLVWEDSPSIDVCRDVFAYARARGIRTRFNCGTELWTNRNCPEGMTPAKWPCVTGVRSYSDKYYCWADDAEIEASANRRIDYLKKFGIEDPVVYIHPVDSCSVKDPEEWSRRCAKCRARWKDDERWKASANLFNIWRREFDKRMPKASFVSPVVPYWISWLERPEAQRNESWRQNVIDYWTKLDAAIKDQNMAFESWIASRRAFDEYRRLIPRRTVRYTDTYPQNPGLFLTCRRKIGTMYEPCGGVAYGMTGTDSYACWESCLLAAEYAWDVHAPGWEPYDGVTYWHPVLDTTGPEIVMTNVLPRICRTFWGNDIAPYMCQVMSSGILPKYLENPAAAVRLWNKVLRNALFDPEQARLQAELGKEALTFADSLDFRRRQLEAARLCARAFEAARPLAGALAHFKRCYFDSLADNTSRWVEQAQELVARSEIDAALEVGDVTRAGGIAKVAADNLREGQIRSRLERIAEILDARSDDPMVPPPQGCAGQSSPSKGWWRNAEVWQGEKVIDTLIVLNRRNIHIMPDSRIVFKGEGRIRVEHGQFRAVDADFVGEGVLTNDWRISVSGEKAEIVNCRFKGLATHNPGGASWYHGSIKLEVPNVRVAGCRFEHMQSLTFINRRKADVVDNVFSCMDVGVYLLNCPESRIERNVFVADSGGKKGIELANSPYSEVVHNRFVGLSVGVYARTGASYVIVAGNAFENCVRSLRTIDSRGTNIIEAHGSVKTRRGNRFDSKWEVHR